jgi:hypothetical protein
MTNWFDRWLRKKHIVAFKRKTDETEVSSAFHQLGLIRCQLQNILNNEKLGCENQVLYHSYLNLRKLDIYLQNKYGVRKYGVLLELMQKNLAQIQKPTSTNLTQLYLELLRLTKECEIELRDCVDAKSLM